MFIHILYSIEILVGTHRVAVFTDNVDCMFVDFFDWWSFISLLNDSRCFLRVIL